METMMRTLKTEELELVAGAGVEPASTKKEKGNNGLGNGDQNAPGGSGPNNGAENNVNDAGGTQGGKPIQPF